jgi:hypothetical protein
MENGSATQVEHTSPTIIANASRLRLGQIIFPSHIMTKPEVGSRLETSLWSFSTIKEVGAAIAMNSPGSECNFDDSYCTFRFKVCFSLELEGTYA